VIGQDKNLGLSRSVSRQDFRLFTPTWKAIPTVKQLHLHIPLVHLALLLCIAQIDQIARGQDTANVSEDPKQLFEPREFAGGDGKVLKYRLLKPLNFNSNKVYPLVIFLHGAGERGDDNTVQLVHGMADFCKTARRDQNPCYVLAPQCPKNEKWADIDWASNGVELPDQPSDSMRLVFELVDSMLSEAALDKNRIYITGLSMGGYGTWDAIARRPDFFAAALPICGGGDPKTAEKIKHIPISCFHGDNDKVVPPERSQTIIDAIKNAGGNPKYTEYPGVGHDSWTRTYSDDAVHQWLFSQRRTSKLPSVGN
jgi:predicted peptidase